MLKVRVPRRTVKARRRYDARGRREQAGRSRDNAIEAAERRFLRDGYASTTIAAIADDAGVSVDTIYKSFGGKAGLIRAIRARALLGEGTVAAEQRSDALHTRQRDPRKIIQGWGVLTTEVVPRAAPILLLVRDAAATDPELRRLLEELDADRLRRMTENARRLHEGGHLRKGLTVARAAEVLWTYSSPELYELLVLRRAMPIQDYGRFVADAISAAVLDASPEPAC
jgi:AcrR family transcriptional regulator